MNIIAAAKAVAPHQGFLATLEAHLTLIYFAAFALVLLLAVLHFTKAVLFHVLIGWLIGILGAGVLASHLVKPAAIGPHGTTVPIPAGYRADIHSVPVTFGVTPVVAGSLLLGLLVTLVVISLILTLRSPSRGLIKKADALVRAAEAGGPPEGGEHR